MKCVNCGTDINENDSFCTSCGASVSSQISQSDNQTQNSTDQQVATKTNKKATYSLICSIVCLFIFWWLGFIAISFGSEALKEIKDTHEKGKGLAIAGIVIGAIAIILFFVGRAIS